MTIRGELSVDKPSRQSKLGGEPKEEHMSIGQLETDVMPSGMENQEVRIREGGQAASQTNLELISKKLEDPNFDTAELLRLATSELVTVLMHMMSLGFTVEELHIRSCLGELVKPLRELRKSLMDTHLLRKKQDAINLDGEACKHLTSVMLSWFVEAQKQAGLEDYERDMVMRNFRDLSAANELQLRRELKAMQR